MSSERIHPKQQKEIFYSCTLDERIEASYGEAYV